MAMSSPKNILVGPDGPVFIDSECAWYGEPAFDLAFCLNHLLLKCLWRPERRRAAFSGCSIDLDRDISRGRDLAAARGDGGPGCGSSAGAAAGPDRLQVADRICQEEASRRTRSGILRADILQPEWIASTSFAMHGPNRFMHEHDRNHLRSRPPCLGFTRPTQPSRLK